MKGFTGFFTLILCFLLSCGNTTTVEEVTYPEVTYTTSTFVDVDYIFNNEGLNQPTMVRVIPETNEVVVLDQGNGCLYVFSHDGEFIRKIGRRGQGPGDLSGAMYFDIDHYGDLYVYETGNFRFSIFSKDGKFHNSFRTNKTIDFRGAELGCCITENREIVTVQAERGYYFTVYSRDGKIIREFGEIQEIIKGRKSLNKESADGFPFVDDYGNYYIFLTKLAQVRKYNPAGILIKEQTLEIPEIQKIKKINPRPEDSPPGLVYNVNLFNEVIFRNNHFYLLGYGERKSGDTETRLFVYVIDLNFNITKKIKLTGLDFGEQSFSTNRAGYMSLRDLQFEVFGEHEEIFIPVRYKAEIIKFSHKK